MFYLIKKSNTFFFKILKIIIKYNFDIFFVYFYYTLVKKIPVRSTLNKKGSFFYILTYFKINSLS